MAGGDKRKQHGWLMKAGVGGMALVVTAAAVLFALFAMGLGPSVPEEDRRVRVVERSIEAATRELGDSASAGLDEEGRSPPIGLLRLDLGASSINVEPGAPGTPLRIEAEYDHSSFELTERFTQEAGGAWIYDVHFGPSFRGPRRILIAHRAPPSLRIVVPRALALSIEARIRHGHSELELGGLSLDSAQLAWGSGSHVVRFSESTAAPMRELSLESSEGQIDVEEIGNASPRTLRARHAVGQLHLDLAGAWQGGADVSVAVSKFGNIELFVPADRLLALVGTELGRIGSVELPTGLADVPEPALAGALRLSAEARNGSVRVLR